MYVFAYLLLVAAFICAIFCAGACLEAISSKRTLTLPLVNKGQILLTTLLTLASLILLLAFIVCDFSVLYVAQYSNRTLPLFYRMTAFWAGQAGSLLFWAWSVCISGLIFLPLTSYKNLSDTTKLWYWAFFMSVMAFFLLLLISDNNPFITFAKAPVDGQGLNPLLQNIGMIIHPPLLFLGYGGFVVPGCLALAQTLSGHLSPDASGQFSEEPWSAATRPFILVAWLLLTAGIILGAWWAYMELGWGGYWAWDPVENASLIPWLVATAYLHTAVIESRRGKLRRSNAFLMALTTISAFFATYLVRSGVIQSLHAFGDGGVGTPLLTFVLFSLALAIYITCMSKETSPDLDEATSKEGLLVFVAWLLLALSTVILIATMWPVIVNALLAVRKYLPFLSNILPAEPQGLEPAFYNKTCLPLFALLSVLLLFCPFRQWKQGWSTPKVMLIALAVALLSGTYFVSISMVHPVAVIGASTAFAAIVGIIGMFIAKPNLLNVATTVGAHGTHIGLLLIVMGVAFSGAYQTNFQIGLDRENIREGKVFSFVKPNNAFFLSKYLGIKPQEYTVRLTGLYEGDAQITADGQANFSYLQADLDIFRDAKFIGTVTPQQRRYTNFNNQIATEVSILPSFGNEIYATLLQVDGNGRAIVQVNVNPLLNWLWIGGIFMCLCPLFGIGRTKKIVEKV